MEGSIVRLYQSSKTVFTLKGLALLWQENNPNNLKARIAYYVKRGVLIRLTRGVFAKDKNYNPQELATSIYLPSYLSFETVLRKSGVVFQHYASFFVASHWSKTVTCDRHTFVFRKIKNGVLYNPAGINCHDGYSEATKERAFLDMIYLFPSYYFDNLGEMNWEGLFELVKIYQNQQLVKRLNIYYKNYAQ